MRNAKLAVLGSGRSVGPATEDITPNSTSSSYYTQVGGGTVHAAMADASDSTYMSSGSFNSTSGTAHSIVYEPANWNGGLSDLASANGRDIASFTVTVRASSSQNAMGVTPTISGATLTGGGFSGSWTSITTKTSSAYTRNSGTLTISHINSMTMFVQSGAETFFSVPPGGSMSAALYRVYVTVTYV